MEPQQSEYGGSGRGMKCRGEGRSPPGRASREDPCRFLYRPHTQTPPPPALGLCSQNPVRPDTPRPRFHFVSAPRVKDYRGQFAVSNEGIKGLVGGEGPRGPQWAPPHPREAAAPDRFYPRAIYQSGYRGGWSRGAQIQQHKLSKIWSVSQWAIHCSRLARYWSRTPYTMSMKLFSK